MTTYALAYPVAGYLWYRMLLAIFRPHYGEREVYGDWGSSTVTDWHSDLFGFGDTGTVAMFWCALLFWPAWITIYALGATIAGVMYLGNRLAAAALPRVPKIAPRDAAQVEAEAEVERIVEAR